MPPDHNPAVPSYTVTLPVSIELRAPSSREAPGVAQQALALLNTSPDVIGIYADMEEADVDPIDLTPELIAKRLAAVQALKGIWAGLLSDWDMVERDRAPHFMDTVERGTPVHFELQRDFPFLFLALRDLAENGEHISATTVTEELLAGDALDADERALLESEVAAALFALSTLPLFQSEQQGGLCPKCGALTPFAEAAFRAQFLERSPKLRCQECGRTSARTAWRWPGDYRLLTAPTRPPSEETAPAVPIYRVALPDGTTRAIATERAFWQAVDDAARWFLHLPAEKRALALAGYDAEGGQLRQIGAAVTHTFVPTTPPGYAALLLIVPAIRDTSYPQVINEDDDDPTPGRIFDVTLHEMIIEHLAGSLDER